MKTVWNIPNMSNRIAFYVKFWVWNGRDCFAFNEAALKCEIALERFSISVSIAFAFIHASNAFDIPFLWIINRHSPFKTVSYWIHWIDFILNKSENCSKKWFSICITLSRAHLSVVSKTKLNEYDRLRVNQTIIPILGLSIKCWWKATMHKDDNDLKRKHSKKGWKIIRVKHNNSARECASICVYLYAAIESMKCYAFFTVLQQNELRPKFSTYTKELNYLFK